MYEEALTASDTATQLDPSNASSWVSRIRALISLHRFEEALSSSLRLIETEPDDVRGWVFHASSLRLLGRVEEALNSYEKAIKLNPEDAIVLGWYGESLRQLNRYKEALQVLERATRMGVPNAPTWFDYVASLLALGRLKKGFNALDSALSRFVGEDEVSVGQAWAILMALSPSLKSSAKLWASSAKIVELFEKHNALLVLGKALSQSIRISLSADVSGESAESWLAMWREAAGDRVELQLPLRLLDAAVRFRKTRDQRVLLELPSEERALLQELMPEEQGEENVA